MSDNPDSMLPLLRSVRQILMALGEVEELFYRHLEESGSEDREGIINRMVEEKVWE